MKKYKQNDRISIFLYKSKLIDYFYAKFIESMDYKKFRIRMVEEQIKSRGVYDTNVINAMLSVPRELFVPEEIRKFAYFDSPLPIGYEQTISQPFIVAFMTQAAKISANSKVLEIGTGCGYQASILAKICKEVYSIEMVKSLAEEAIVRTKELSYNNIHIRVGDGYNGWLEQAPFDAIIVTAAPISIPKKLMEQLKEEGCMVIPIGSSSQELLRITRRANEFIEETLMPVRFVPMVH